MKTLKQGLDESIVYTQKDVVGNSYHVKKLSSGTYDLHKQYKSGEWNKVSSHKSLESAKQSIQEECIHESKLGILDRLAWKMSKDSGTGGPKDLVKRAKSYDTDTLKKLQSKETHKGKSPAAIQQKVIAHELNRRSRSEMSESDETATSFRSIVESKFTR